MAYTSSTPQASDAIANTQSPILANFGFIATGLAVDHHFDSSTNGSTLYHNQCSMPNQALASLPAGTNGAYFVNGGIPQFYNGTTTFKQMFGTNGKTSALASGGTIQVLLSGIYSGIISIINSNFTTDAIVFPFYMNGATLTAYGSNGQAVLQPVTNNLLLKNTSGSSAANFYWTIAYMIST